MSTSNLMPGMSPTTGAARTAGRKQPRRRDRPVPGATDHRRRLAFSRGPDGRGGLLVSGASVATSVVAGPVMAAAVREVGAGATGALAGSSPARPVVSGVRWPPALRRCRQAWRARAVIKATWRPCNRCSGKARRSICNSWNYKRTCNRKTGDSPRFPTSCGRSTTPPRRRSPTSGASSYNAVHLSRVVETLSFTSPPVRGERSPRKSAGEGAARRSNRSMAT